MAKKEKASENFKGIRKGDEVRVMRGKAKGKSGKVAQVFREFGKGNEMVLIQGLNTFKRHMKPNQKSKQGGVIDKEMPVHISNLIKTAAGERRAAGSKEKKAE